MQKLARRTGTGDFPYTVDVPPTYDPAKRYQVRVQLHGGVMRPDPAARGDGSIGALAGAEQIYVLPQSWAEAQWWAPAQDENLPAILDRVKRTYNVDENRVVLSGVSDGGTAAYYFAMRDTTPYASFLPLNGFILVLRNRDLRLRGALFPHNLTNKPFFVVNGGKDPLYPAAGVAPFLTQFKAGGLRPGLPAAARGRPQHGVVARGEGRLRGVRARAPARAAPGARSPGRPTTRRHAEPRRTGWSSTGSAPPRPGEALPDINDFAAGEEPNFGVRAVGMRVTSVLPGSNAEAFGFLPATPSSASTVATCRAASTSPSSWASISPARPLHFVVERGRRDGRLERHLSAHDDAARVAALRRRACPAAGSMWCATATRCARRREASAAFTLLLSPDVFDFTRPVTVVADGKTVFSGLVQKSVADADDVGGPRQRPHHALRR